MCPATALWCRRRPLAGFQLEFHDADNDSDTDTDILARILDTRDFTKLFLPKAERHADILARRSSQGCRFRCRRRGMPALVCVRQSTSAYMRRSMHRYANKSPAGRVGVLLSLPATLSCKLTSRLGPHSSADQYSRRRRRRLVSVSYTHLTLPTIYSV